MSKIDSDGWYSRIEVFVSGEGVEFEVKSDFKMKSPVDAVNQCYRRLMKAISGLPNVENMND